MVEESCVEHKRVEQPSHEESNRTELLAERCRVLRRLISLRSLSRTCSTNSPTNFVASQPGCFAICNAQRQVVPHPISRTRFGGEGAGPGSPPNFGGVGMKAVEPVPPLRNNIEVIRASLHRFPTTCQLTPRPHQRLRTHQF